MARFSGFGFIACVVLGSMVSGNAEAQVCDIDGMFALPPFGQGIYARESGDFDGDGNNDIAGLTDEGLWIFMGNGDTTFEDGVLYPVGDVGNDSAALLVRADVDGDGVDDFVGEFQESVRVWLGEDGGAFGDAVVSYIESYGYSASRVIDDFTGDGVADLVFRSHFTGPAEDLLLAKGSADGSFDSGATVALGFAGLHSNPVGGDFNGDGRMDFVVTETGNNLVIYLSDGAGGFTESDRTFMGAQGFVAQISGDFDGDGFVDIAGVGNNWGSIVIVYGDGAGEIAGSEWIDRAEVMGVRWVGDLNGDGSPDFTVMRRAPNVLEVWVGDGGRAHSFGASYLPLEGVVDDFDGDGSDDFAAKSDEQGRGMYVAAHVGGVLFDMCGAYQVSQEVGGGFTRAMDVDGDGIMDLTHSSALGGAFGWVRYGRGDGTFGDAVRAIALPELPHGMLLSCDLVAVGEFTGDGHRDIVWSGEVEVGPGVVREKLLLTRGRGDGTFEAYEVTALDLGGFPVGGDFNGDGIDDLIAGELIEGENEVQFEVRLGGASGDFSSTYGGGLFVDNDSWSVRVLDIEGDGDLDVLRTRPGELYVNTGGGFFSMHPVINGMDSAIPGDFDRDGDTDVVGLRGHDLVTYLNDGSGGFVVGFETGVERGGNLWEAGDLNGDGEVDLLVRSPVFNSDDSGVLWGLGGGAFFAGDLDSGVPRPAQRLYADLDGDGLSDGVSFRGHVCLNNGVCSFCPADVNEDGVVDVDDISMVLFRLGASAYEIQIQADANGDGAVDVLDIIYVQGRLGDTVEPGTGGDVNGDGVVDQLDIDFIVARLEPVFVGYPGGDANLSKLVDVNDIAFVLFRLGEKCR